MKTTIGCLTLLFLIGSELQTAAAPIGPVYPAPGGNSFAGGLYSGFDTGAFIDLYFGVDSATPPSAGLDGTLLSMTYAGAVGQVATWSVTSPYVSAGGPGDPASGSYPIELRMTISSLGANPWIADPTTVGLPAGTVIVDNSSGLDFTRTVEFVADMGAGFIPLTTVPQGPPGGQSVSSVSTGFYYTIPEPSTFALAALGLLGMGYFRRKRA